MAKVIVVGGGFAGVWAALAASSQRMRAARPLDIAVVSRDRWLTIKPRLYEEDVSDTRVPLDDVLRPAGVERVEGHVRELDGHAHRITLADGRVLRYDRLVLAAGSAVERAAIPGARDAFAVDSYQEAVALQEHLTMLPLRPNAPGRFTAVVIGSGLTGIEVATSMARRMRRAAASAGADRLSRVVLLERGPTIAPDLGEHARVGGVLESHVETGRAFEGSFEIEGRPLQIGSEDQALRFDIESAGQADSNAIKYFVGVGLNQSPKTRDEPCHRRGRIGRCAERLL